MQIIKAYKTSKGIFYSLGEASLKVNRQKEYGSRPGEVSHEVVKEVFILEENGLAFELNKVKVN